MPIKNDPLPAKKLVLFFVVDTSYSMEGAKIGALNNAVEEVIPMLGEISKDNNDAIVEIAVLQFSSGVKWSYSSPIPAENFSWRTLSVDGATDFGAACTELLSKLTTKGDGFMSSPSGAFAPVFILLSDGGPTDNYKTPLKNLREKNWFKAGVRIAIAIGDDANLSVLEEFTGSKESVFTVHNIEALKKIIRCVSVTSSSVASKTTDTANETKQEQIEKEISNEMQEEIKDGEITPATGGEALDDDWE
ncbi:MAG: VWA domain-containing protein [Flavobacteriales bacterium]|nr:VWA domain-containing protein [Flavobacteriales bacterium]